MAGKTVFVIDADSETEQIIASTLESEGYLVFAVPGAGVGAEIAQKVKPSLIFVNPEDTSEKGMEVCKRIRGYEAMKNIPIILLASRPGDPDVGSYGVVDSILLPVNAAELLEKTGRAVATKDPVVLRIKEKAPEYEEGRVPAEGTLPSRLKDAGARSRLWDLSEGGGEGAEETDAAPQKGWEEDVAYIPEEETGSGRTSKRLLVVLLAVLLAVVGTAGALYFSGLMPPGMGSQEMVVLPLKKAVKKMDTPQPPPAAMTQQTVSDNPATAPSAAPAPPAEEEKIAAKASSVPAPEKSAAVSKSPGKTVYSVQVGVFKNEKNAVALVKLLKHKGYDAFTLKCSIKEKGTAYRVLVGRSDDRPKSRELAAAIGEKEKIKTVIFSE